MFYYTILSTCYSRASLLSLSSSLLVLCSQAHKQHGKEKDNKGNKYNGSSNSVRKEGLPTALQYVALKQHDTGKTVTLFKTTDFLSVGEKQLLPGN